MDPNVYQGPGNGGTHHSLVNMAAEGFDNTGATDINAGGKLAAFFALLVASGQAAWFTAGTYKIATPVLMPSNLVVWGSPQAKLVSAVTGTGYSNAMFFAEPTNVGTIASTTLSAGVAKGSRIIPVASSVGFAAGQSVILGSVLSSNTAQQFTVVSTGVGTVTVDDPVEFTFVMGDTFLTFNPPTAIRFYGNGMQCTGSGGALFEWDACQRCVIQDLDVPTTTVTSYVGSFDVGGRDNSWERVRVNGGGTAPYGLSLESNVRSKFIDCTATNCTAAGFWESTGADNEHRGCKAWNNLYGAALMASSATDPDSCQRGSMVGCNYESNGSAGIYLHGATDYEIVATSCDWNTTIGIAFEKSTVGVPCTGIQLANVAVRGGAYGLYVDTGTHIVRGRNVTTDLCTSGGLYIVDTAIIDISGYSATDCTLTGGGVVDAQGVAQLSLSGRIRKTQNNTGNWVGVNLNGAAVVHLSDLVFERVGTPTGNMFGIIFGAAALAWLTNVTTVGTLTYGLYSSGVVCVVRLLPGCSFDSCTTPNSLDGMALQNRGNVTTTTTITFPIAADEQIVLQPNAATSAAYVSARTNGTSFAVHCAASTDYAVL